MLSGVNLLSCCARPPTNQPESEFERYACNLDAGQKEQAVRVLRALFDKDSRAA